MTSTLNDLIGCRRIIKWKSEKEQEGSTTLSGVTSMGGLRLETFDQWLEDAMLEEKH